MANDKSEENTIKRFSEVQNEGLEIFTKKNYDYGSSYKEYGTIGILIRIGDKFKRMVSVSSKSVNLVKDESLRDTLIDLHNYSAMAIMILDEESKNKQDK